MGRGLAISKLINFFVYVLLKFLFLIIFFSKIND